jgi:hypothetical protein
LLGVVEVDGSQGYFLPLVVRMTRIS